MRQICLSFLVTIFATLNTVLCVSSVGGAESGREIINEPVRERVRRAADPCAWSSDPCKSLLTRLVNIWRLRCCKDGIYVSSKGLIHLPLPKCPEHLFIRFDLYTKSNPNNAEVITKDKLGDNNFENKNIGILTHGFKDKGKSDWILKMKDELLKRTNYQYVIIVAWGIEASPLRFLVTNKLKLTSLPKAFTIPAASTRSVGAATALLLQSLKEKKKAWLYKMHCIGHSLGAHVCGHTGKWIYKRLGVKLGRITGMDPAGPGFGRVPFTKLKFPACGRLDKDDASHVDIIHTTVTGFVPFGLGIRDPIGHIDFYPNGGKCQPKCRCGKVIKVFGRKIVLPSFPVCSHSHAVELFTESISRCRSKFKASRCSNAENAIQGKCTIPTSQTMGFNAKYYLWGIFYLQTKKKEPYC